jgi:hypothetical protein
MNAHSVSATMERLFLLLITIALVALVSCAPTKTATAEEIRSDLTSADSLAAETDLLIGEIKGGRLLPQFRAGHADYLRDETLRQVRELREAKIEHPDTPTIALCAKQLESLTSVLTSVRDRDDDGTLAESSRHVEAISRSLATLRAGP